MTTLTFIARLTFIVPSWKPCFGPFAIKDAMWVLLLDHHKEGAQRCGRCLTTVAAMSRKSHLKALEKALEHKLGLMWWYTTRRPAHRIAKWQKSVHQGTKKTTTRKKKVGGGEQVASWVGDMHLQICFCWLVSHSTRLHSSGLKKVGPWPLCWHRPLPFFPQHLGILSPALIVTQNAIWSHMYSNGCVSFTIRNCRWRDVLTHIRTLSELGRTCITWVILTALCNAHRQRRCAARLATHTHTARWITTWTEKQDAKHVTWQ